jgi:hypothetical protein
VKAYFLIISLLLAAPAEASQYSRSSLGSVMSAAPTTEAGRVEYAQEKGGGRGPASLGALNRNGENRRLCEKMEPGQIYMIKNSVRDWDDKVVTVVDKFEDCSVRVRMPNGQKAFVRFKNLAKTLSPEAECVPSHGIMVCKGDQVFYPARTSSMELPEGPVAYAFEHGVVVVRDGADFVLDASQVGKSVACSPQKESICVGDYVYAEGFKLDRKFNFEGPVKKAYTHGVVVVESDHFWKYPIDVAAVKKRVMSEDGENNPAVITTRGSRGKDLPYNVTPEIEPSEPTEGDSVRNAR